MASPRFLYVRHAESTWNARGRWQGQADPPLSAAGRAQARSLARRLAGRGVLALACSDLRRATETATIVGAELGFAPRAHAGLRELDAGCWSGLTRDEVARRWPDALARFRSGDPDAAPTQGETRRALGVRVVAALRELLAATGERRLLVVGHLGALRALVPEARLGNAEWLELDASLLETVGPAARYAAASPGDPL